MTYCMNYLSLCAFVAFIPYMHGAHVYVQKVTMVQVLPRVTVYHGMGFYCVLQQLHLTIILYRLCF